ncbi:MAG TPA: polysaccharide lyase family protein [Micromonosporaceae bacterium]|nr:polysaccharide lyase family protein [Micromonosporaceae bacterium]
MENDARRITRRTALGLIGAAAGTAALGSPGAAFAAEPTDVELIDDGTTVTLRNSLISATVNKANARTTSLQLIGSAHGNEGFNILGGARGGGYTTFNYRIGETSFVKAVSGGSYRVVSQTPDRVEIAITVNDSALLPFVVETHVALERNAPGLYYYLIFRYPTEMPDGLNIGQLRYAFSAEDDSFTYFVVDDERGVQQRPTIEQTQQWLVLQDATHILPDGTLYSKYQNKSNLEGDNDVFMISNGRVGLSLIQASKEAFVGGPTKQELTTHDYYRGEILLWHPFTSHYGTPALIPDKGWEKIYGPFFLYADESAVSTDPVANVQDMWNRAKQRAQQEKARWPYSWVSDPLYAPTTRSTVSGRLRIKGGQSAANAWVILSAPGGDWQFENEGYIYSVRADDRGRFTVPHVRPGVYTLSAFVDGVFGEYKKHGVTVGARKTHDLSTLHFYPRSAGRTLWQIGTPDRSAGEFHMYGGPNGYRQYLTWLEYPYEFPNDVDFKVGVDDIAEKWNYFQPAYRTPGTDRQLAWRGTTPDRSLTTWKIRFDSAGYAAGTATLDIALAGSVFGTLRVALNGVDIVSFTPVPGPPGDASIYRHARRGIYRELPPITFPASAIRPGENVITLSPTRPPVAPTADNWMDPMAGLMYDVIRLQVDAPR